MDNIRKSVFERYRCDDRVRSIVAMEKKNGSPTFTNGCDMLFLIIAAGDTAGNVISHYIQDGFRIQERRVASSDLERAIRRGKDDQIIFWILRGEILLDRGTYMEGIRHRLFEFPPTAREEKLLSEFAAFVEKYLRSKERLQSGQILDAYTDVLEALKHWARIVIIEDGKYPEETVWSQVYQINPGVYKLFEELTQSQETLEQRIQLVLLACDFSVMSKMEKCCGILLQVLQSREEPWSLNELEANERLSGAGPLLPMLLKQLEKKSLIREVAVAASEDAERLEMKYTGK